MKNYKQKDIWLNPIIIGALGPTLVASVKGTIGLAGKSTPKIFVELRSMAIDGLTESLVPTYLDR